MDYKLSTSSNNNKVDEILSGIIGVYETSFQDKISGYYVEGSYSDKTEISTSDIDLTIMFKKFENDLEYNKAEELIKQIGRISPIELDVNVTDEHIASKDVRPNFKLGSFLVYGKDIRDSLSLMPIAEWARKRMHISYWQISKIFNRPDRVTLPLNFPKPKEEFYGYTDRKVKLASGEEVPCTRDLIRVIGWAATALIALKAKKYVARKKDCHIIYRETINDEWSDLLEDIYFKCRNEWNYQIPTDERDQKKFKELLKRTLEFENYFIKVYKEFLLSELHNENIEDQKHAIWVMGQIPLDDAEVINTLYNLKDESLDPSILEELVNTFKVIERN